jgi:hypothetical protein
MLLMPSIPFQQFVLVPLNSDIAKQRAAVYQNTQVMATPSTANGTAATSQSNGSGTGQETLLSKMLSTLLSRFLAERGLLTSALVPIDGIKHLLAADPVLSRIADSINKVLQMMHFITIRILAITHCHYQYQ